MRDCFAEDIYRSEEHLEFMNERVAELEDLFKSFQEILRSHSLLMKQSYDKAKCNELCQSIGPGEFFPSRWIYFVGFTTLSHDYSRVCSLSSPK